MGNITTERATKKAYFSDLDGSHIIEFQFSPESLSFAEGGNFAERLSTGNYFADYVWISGKPAKFTVQLFIDRTQESFVADNYNEDQFANVTRFPASNPRYSSFDLVNLVRGLAQGNSSSGFMSNFTKGTKSSGNSVTPSSYSASPHYKQTQFDENAGVLRDLENLMYFVRPKGMTMAEASFKQDGSFSIKDFTQNRFTPPPMVRFYYGAIWREGYVTNVNYDLSVMNKVLVPKRMDAYIEIACTKWGYLNDVSPEGLTNALSVDQKFKTIQL